MAIHSVLKSELFNIFFITKTVSSFFFLYSNNNFSLLSLQLSYENIQKKLTELRSYVEKNAEYVGDKFVSEVRSIHYDKKNVRSIYGNASSNETSELLEEGIEINSIPWVDKTNS